MKRTLTLCAIALVVIAAVGTADTYLKYTPNRYWSDSGVFRTDGAIQSVGAANGLYFAYEEATTATMALNVTGQLTLNAPINWAGITPAGTAGSLITTGTTWVTFPTAGAAGVKLLLENDAATGSFSTLRMRARANMTTAEGNGNSSVGVSMAGDFSASAYANDFGNLFAVNACAQPNALNQTTDDTNVVCALYGRIDATGTSLGRRWVEWIDTHATTKAANGDYMVRVSHNGTVALDGCFTVYNGGRLPVLFNFEDATTNGFLVDSGAIPSGAAAGYLAVRTPAGTKYIQLYTAGS